MSELWTLENEIYDSGERLICGVDEAGRGPLAGPVYAVAVILPRNIEIEGLNDSKKLSEKKREALFDIICSESISFGIASATVEEIEQLNILNAAMLAMNRAIEQLSEKPSLALIDGNHNSAIKMPSRCVVKGDAKCADIAAASILAKVSRDRYMLLMSEKYPEYAFDRHKGYGTKLHYEKLRQYGPCEIHRPSFLRKMH